MTHNEFNLWINGYILLSTEDDITQKQMSIIKNHAELVKAVEGYWDQKITRFLADLEHFFSSDHTMSFEVFKKIGTQLTQ